MTSHTVGYTEHHGDITRRTVATIGTWAVRVYTTPDEVPFYDAFDHDPNSTGLTPPFEHIHQVREHIRRDEAGLL